MNPVIVHLADSTRYAAKRNLLTDNATQVRVGSINCPS